jgi:hypothetical protein
MVDSYVTEPYFIGFPITDHGILLTMSDTYQFALDHIMVKETEKLELIGHIRCWSMKMPIIYSSKI